MQQKLQMNHLVGKFHVYKSILLGRDVCGVDGGAVANQHWWYGPSMRRGQVCKGYVPPNDHYRSLKPHCLSSHAYFCLQLIGMSLPGDTPPEVHHNKGRACARATFCNDCYVWARTQHNFINSVLAVKTSNVKFAVCWWTHHWNSWFMIAQLVDEPNKSSPMLLCLFFSFNEG